MKHIFRKVAIATSICFFSFGLLSQNLIDAVRYSNTNLQGTARFEAMAGSYGALGADLSANQINPAGYGQYSSSVIGVTGNYDVANTIGNYDGNSREVKKGNFKTPNISAVFTGDISKNNRGFLYHQFGLSYNRLANFTLNKSYYGRNAISLLDDFASSGQGLDPDYLPPFTTLLAWNTYAIDPDGQGGYVANLLPTDVMNQRRDIETKGGMGDFSFNYSMNYLNKLFLGANVALRSINYKENYTHSEQTDPTSLALIDSFNYSYGLQTKGTGFNFKIGAIYVPVRFLRLGLAFHTRTYYSLTDQWTANMTTYRQDGVFTIPEAYIPYGKYKYRYQSPGKLIASVGFIILDRASFNVDAELVNYKGNKFRSTKDFSYDPEPNDYANQNAEIKENLRTVVNLRIGGEVVFARKFFVRAGFGYYPQPYKQLVSDSRQNGFVYSAGLGVKLNRFNIDLAYKRQNANYDYISYPGSTTRFQEKNNYVVASFSFRF